MLRFSLIILLSLSAALPALSQKPDSLLAHILSTQLLPDYHALKYSSYTTYEKTQTAIHDIEAFKKNSKLRKHKWIRAIVDATGASDTMTIPFMSDQRVTRVYWRKNPESETHKVLGINREGLNDVFDAGDLMGVIVAKKFPLYSAYTDLLVIDGEGVASPMSTKSGNYYNYKNQEVTDSTIVIAFSPKTDKDQDLSGTITLAKDSIWRLKQTKLNLQRKHRKRGVDYAVITQNFIIRDGRTIPQSTEFLVELHKWGVLGKIQIKKDVMFSDLSLDSIPDKIFSHCKHYKAGKKGHIKVRYSNLTDYRQPSFWAPYDQKLSNMLREYQIQDSLHQYSTIEIDSSGVARHRQSAAQEFLCDGLDYANSLGKGMKFLTVPLKALINDYIEIGKKPFFSIEPVYSLMSFNDIDKFRLRFGGYTTANLFKRLFFGGYLAYGCGSKNVYYRGTALYSFIDKVYEPDEFPKRYIGFESRYDICFLGERNNLTDHDNLFKSFRWKKNAMMIYYHIQKVLTEWDMRNGVGFRFSLKRESDYPAGNFFFKTMKDLNTLTLDLPDANKGIAFDNGSVTTTELRFEFLYYPKTKQQMHRKNLLPINTELPSISLAYTVGAKIFGGNYSYHLTELEVAKDWYLGPLGIGKTSLKLGKIWSTVPFPLLLAPPANISYFGDNDNSFNLIKSAGFVNDRYIQLFMSVEPNGILIGKIPIIKKLRWREYVGVKVLLGALSDKNNPNLPEHKYSDILMALPSGAYIMDGNVPYVEGTIGIHHILHIFNIDYVHRFTYRNLPNVSLCGVRFSVHFDN